MGEDILALLEATRRDVDQQIVSLLEGQRDLKLQVQDVQDKMRDVLLELGGAPDAEYRPADRKSMRARMHDFENFVAQNTLAEVVVHSAREERRQMQKQRDHAWSQRHTLAMFAIAVILMCVTLLQFFGVGGG